jgi:nitrite reductase/ring-hydroxylating ferredoxin subunit
MPHDDLPKNTGKVLTDQHVALYRDQDGGLHAISSVCTHMGCDVGWNDLNKVWDCLATALGLHRPAMSSTGRR